MNRAISKTQSKGPGGMKLGSKRKADVSPTKKMVEPKKRSAFGDITNQKLNEANVKAVDSYKPRTRSSLRLKAESEDLKKEKLTPIEKTESKVPSLGSGVPEGVHDFDAECGDDPFQVGNYVADIFAYYKRRESKFPVKKYLDTQRELNKNMRAILVDWMVEVQENFELNHETLYLGVKLVDMFLGKTAVSRDRLQLVGTTALYVAAKFDERSPPLIDDFCYICDDAYPVRDVLRMEVKLLKALDYDMGIPLSYRFLRRYARCIKLEMDTLTFARYILETSLLEYDLVDVRDSMLASACLLLALTLKGVKDAWTPALEYYSGYKMADLFDLTHRVFLMLSTLPIHLKTIMSKYSHKVFFEVAKIPIPEALQF